MRKVTSNLSSNGDFTEVQKMLWIKTCTDEVFEINLTHNFECERVYICERVLRGVTH